MTNTRSPLQDLNMRRAHHAPMDELHKTLETLEQRLKEMTEAQPVPAASKSDFFEPELPSRAGTRMNLAEITASLDSRLAAGAEKKTPAKRPVALSKADLTFDEELARIESSVEVLTAQNAENNGDDASLRHARETAEHLQDELEALKRMMQTMAREESIRKLSHRWDQFDEKFEAFEQSQNQKAEAEFPELNSISDRLDDVRRAIDAMPQMQTVSIQPLEDRISGLALSIEQMIGQKNEYAIPSALDERLDEISRAILAGNMKRPDIEEIRRAEALSQELLTRMADLSQRIDCLSENSSLPLQQIETLAKQIRLIATYIDRALESGPALELEKVNTRLDDITQQLNSVEARFSMPQEAVFAALDQRFDALVLRLDEQFSKPADNQDMMQNLEAQIASIAKQLAEPQDHHPLIKSLSPRLEQIETAVHQTREDTLDIARKAAEEAMEKFAAQAHQYDNGLVKELAEDMRALEQLARSNDERNEKSFDTVHATLQKVVERLSALEVQHKAAAPAFTAPKASTAPVVPAMAQAAENVKAAFDAPKATAETTKPLFSATKEASTTVSSDLSDVSASHEQPIIERSGELPDLNAIMKRVRGEPGLATSLRQEKDLKTDVISAARSAAQMAAQQAGRISTEEKISSTESKTPKKSSFTQLIARQRKPIFLGLGAIMMALAALQAGEIYFNKSLVAEQPQIANSATTVEELIERDTVVSQTKTETTPVIAATTPALEEKAEAPQIASFTPVNAEPAVETVTDIEPAADQIAMSALPEITPEAGPAALRQAAADGDAMALFEIGNRYTDGIGMQADLSKAATFYAASATRGFAPAQYRYGNLNEKGLGLPRNIEQARHWYLKAAEKGNASAMHNLAVLYATGGDNAPDNKEAIKWFEKAAELDVKDSQYNLGILYAQGMGTKLDLGESYKWFALAAQSGDKDAADKRDQVAKALNGEHLKQAEGKVALWKPKPLDQAANSVTIPDSWMDENPVKTASVDMKKAVRNIQLILQNNGYDIGTADGLMGDKTRNAIKKFQHANGEEPTGEVNPQLVQLLLAHNK
ncbi:localization factor PodJL [Paenochrobactrum gallinarii]|uniref:Localization factor PodJL n=1 Tax=Paenochrobactrum gallinarii TaxID=643673 RepID=A0A841LVM5_9HYPH|nr:peptidoglycan-binding protein [Paenochrobactrum gallinarii]MBB6260547.1 localization factor PodJL [Paenochrobactrum gallinarii]